jgi:hypothetical protein
MPTVTAEGRFRSAHWARLARTTPVLAAVAVAVAVAAYFLSRDDDAGRREPLAVEATSIYDFATLDELVAASDAIVVGTVVAVDEGRLVGAPAEGAVVSRVASLRVDTALAGEVADVVVIEEEGWLPDGTPLIVNGVAPSAAGNEGVWFLDSIDDAELPGYLVINSQGRYLIDPSDPTGPLVGGDRDDPLVRDLERLTLPELIAAIDDTTDSAPEPGVESTATRTAR